MKASRWRHAGKPVLAAAGASSLVASLGATVTELGPWYQSLQKPAWQPPDWLFAPVWTVIFALIALSAAQAWLKMPKQRDWILGLYALNSFLNILWSALFFKLKRPDLALVELVPFWLSIALLITFVRPGSRLAAWLLVPYLAWVTFAGILNYEVARLNGFLDIAVIDGGRPT